MEVGSTAGDLLAAPLPASDDEGALDDKLESGPRARESDPGRTSTPGIGGKSLAEIAKSVATAKRDDPDDDVASASLSFASRSRPSASEIAATLSARRSSPSIPPPSAPPPSAEPAAPVPIAPRRSNNGPLIGGAIAVLALAAALVLMIGNRKSSEPPLMITNNNATAPAVTAATAQDKAKADDNVLSPDQLPNGAAPKPAAELAPAAHGAAPARSVAKAPETAPTAAPAESITLQETPEPPAAPKDTEEPGTPAAHENVPDKPAAGDISAAIASVLGSARACVAGQDAPSQAVIVFGSDGRVQSVSVSGPAAGTPSAGCISSALRAAHVHRFARPSFSVRTPVRP